MENQLLCAAFSGENVSGIVASGATAVSHNFDAILNLMNTLNTSIHVLLIEF